MLTLQDRKKVVYRLHNREEIILNGGWRMAEVKFLRRNNVASVSEIEYDPPLSRYVNTGIRTQSAG